jgi:hypothetical protein
VRAIGVKLHGQADLSDEFADRRADHVDAEDAIVVCAGYDLHEAFALVLQLGAAVGGEGETPDLVRATARFYLTTTSKLAAASDGEAGMVASILKPPFQLPVLLVSEG